MVFRTICWNSLQKNRWHPLTPHSKSENSEFVKTLTVNGCPKGVSHIHFFIYVCVVNRAHSPKRDVWKSSLWSPWMCILDKSFICRFMQQCLLRNCSAGNHRFAMRWVGFRYSFMIRCVLFRLHFLSFSSCLLLYIFFHFFRTRIKDVSYECFLNFSSAIFFISPSSAFSDKTLLAHRL
jgi:hypothetical protein